MRSKINVILALFASALVCVIFLPVHVSGGLARVDYTGTTTLFNYLFSHNDICIDCFNYSIIVWILLLEAVISFFAFYKLLLFVDEKRK